MKEIWKDVKRSLLWILYLWKMGSGDILLILLLLWCGTFSYDLIDKLLPKGLKGLEIRVILCVAAYLLISAGTYWFLKRKYKYLGWVTNYLVGVWLGLVIDIVVYVFAYATVYLFFMREGNISAGQLTSLTCIAPGLILALVTKIVYDVWKHKKDKEKMSNQIGGEDERKPK